MTLILFPRHRPPANAVRERRAGGARVLKLERTPAPAKQWRNKWRVTANVLLSGGRLARPGDVLDADRVWPSRDAAETAAARDLAFMSQAYGRTIMDHLGAFPVSA